MDGLWVSGSRALHTSLRGLLHFYPENPKEHKELCPMNVSSQDMMSDGLKYLKQSQELGP